MTVFQNKIENYESKQFAIANGELRDLLEVLKSAIVKYRDSTKSVLSYNSGKISNEPQVLNLNEKVQASEEYLENKKKEIEFAAEKFNLSKTHTTVLNIGVHIGLVYGTRGLIKISKGKPFAKKDSVKIEDNGSYEAKIPRSGSEWDEYFKSKYGSENVEWGSKATKTSYEKSIVFIKCC